jgi:hydroxymethylbilane synthase
VKLRIGTRGSRLAMAQAREVAARLEDDGHRTELVPITTAGDRGAPADASPQGVKGLFVGEIVRALQDGVIDLAVHSAKDLPAEDPPGIVVAAVPPRADPRDVLVWRGAPTQDATIGTSSVRRASQLRRARPASRIIQMRGNVDTRLRKLEAGDANAIAIAAAGLARLGVAPSIMETLPAGELVPAPGQGALAVQARERDDEAHEVLERVDDPNARRAVTAERTLVALLGGGCSLPLGAFASTDQADAEVEVHLVAVVSTPDGSTLVRAEARGGDPIDVARAVGDALRREGATAILDAVRERSAT